MAKRSGRGKGWLNKLPTASYTLIKIFLVSFYGQMADFIEANFFTLQTHRVKQLGDYVMTLGRIGAGSLGEYHFDKFTLRDGGDN